MSPDRQSYFARRPLYIAGPCSAETESQVLQIAHALHKAGICIFRAGLWKPRTHPATFEGVGKDGLIWLQRVQKETGMAVATEVAAAEHVHLCCEAGIDCLWTGARTTASPFLMQEIADSLASLPAEKQPVVMVKNPVSPDLDLWIGAIERLQRAGLQHIVAVHRGFSTPLAGLLRNQPIWSIPIELRRRMPEIPVICDPSHITGKADLVGTIAQDALNLNFDGLMIECHCNPAEAWSDAPQQLTPAALQALLRHLHIRQQSEADDTLLALRQEIDETDEQIWQLIRKRLATARAIGRHKAAHNMPVLQSNRYEQLLQKRTAWAKANGISEEAARQVMQILHEESVRVQLQDKP